MNSQSNEQRVWRFLHKCRNGIGVNELSRKTEVTKPTLKKILDRFLENRDIVKPKQKRGKKTIVILTRFTPKDNFRKMKKYGSVIMDNYDQPIIIITKDGKTYVGHIGDYDPGILYIYNGHLLRSNKWIPLKNQLDHEISIKRISVIYEPNYDNFELSEISINDTMSLWLDPTHNIIHGIYCPWPTRKEHSKECQFVLHESLVNIYTTAHNNAKSEKERDELLKSMEYLVVYLLKNGAVIPFGNN